MPSASHRARPAPRSSPGCGPRRSMSGPSSCSTSIPIMSTKAVWMKLTDLFVEERKKGVLDVSQVPSSITAHDAGYIDKDLEIIVGLQTEAPLKRAIMPNGGLRMVLSALE